MGDHSVFRENEERSVVANRGLNESGWDEWGSLELLLSLLFLYMATGSESCPDFRVTPLLQISEEQALQLATEEPTRHCEMENLSIEMWVGIFQLLHVDQGQRQASVEMWGVVLH